MTAQPSPVFLWSCADYSFQSKRHYANPFQTVNVRATFTAPSGLLHAVDGFWDGDLTWRVRFAPNEVGLWHYVTNCSEHDNEGLHNQQGTFVCQVGATDGNRFQSHGPLRLSASKTYLAHADGTPFFWLADTAWNGPLRSSSLTDWHHYLETRVRQGFTAVQWVTTQWRAAPDGDIEGNLAYSGTDEITVNPPFFQRLDEYVEATSAAGLLNVPVLLWTLGSQETLAINPGHTLPEDQAVRLVRYMVARWGAYPVVWILPGDGNYGGEKAEKWKRIGRAAFDDERAPVAIHCCGQHFPADEFRGEPWLDILGYQSGHGDGDESLAWITSGPPAQEWAKVPRLFQLNLEPPYENHLAYQSKRPHTPHSVRVATYWSLFNAPTAGVTYGGHGVWGWDDGTAPPVDHPGSGVPLPWAEAVTMPAAEELIHLITFLTEIDWWRLRPSPELLLSQPGQATPSHFISASMSALGDIVLLYLPTGGEVTLHTELLAAELQNATWLNPRTGERLNVSISDANGRLQAPDNQDWLLKIVVEG